MNLRKFIKKIDEIFFLETFKKVYTKYYVIPKIQNHHKNYVQKITDLRQYKYLTYWNNHFNHIDRHKLEGDIVECGVGDGLSLSYILFNLISNKNFLNKKYYGFDSFEGFPEPDIKDISNRNPQKGQWSHSKKEYVLENLRILGFTNDHFKKIEFIKGFFSNTFKHHTSLIDKLCLLHVDCDLYLSTKNSLEIWYPKVISGGIIVFDEYLHDTETFPGTVKAIDEFFGDKIKKIKQDKISGKYYYIKD